jgi:hypothetical protein
MAFTDSVLILEVFFPNSPGNLDRPSASALQLERNPLNTWFINNFEKFKLIDGILYRVINANGELVRQLVLPETCIATVMTSRLWISQVIDNPCIPIPMVEMTRC